MLDQFTDEQLEQEVAKRQQIKEEKEKPKQIEQPDLTRLRRSCREYIDTIANEGYRQKHGDHYIFEAAMSAIYGSDIFLWINKRS